MSTTNISCPKCNAKNRIPSARLGDRPRCGKCKTPLFQGKVMEITPANITPVLSHNDIPVLIDCWAPWCGPCKNFAPIFEQAARELEPALRFAKLNTEAQPSIAGRWNIRSIPTLILYQDGKEVSRSSGAMPLPQLKQWLGQNGIR